VHIWINLQRTVPQKVNSAVQLRRNCSFNAVLNLHLLRSLLEVAWHRKACLTAHRRQKTAVGMDIQLKLFAQPNN